MNILKFICLTLLQLAKQAGLIPQILVRAIKQRRQQAALNDLEIERLDRIRNPSKYRGKEL
ncbi:MAG: hypothetical protein IH623_12935 [Verrucomicrobia bacterium]|jgi:hypothetical protein|nr:hypothetical protein [Verrucomicrobiota bacterium]